MILLYFTIAMGTNGSGFYFPKIIRDLFRGQDTTHIGLISAIPHLSAIVAMFFVGAHSDRHGERRWHVAMPAFGAAVGWALSTYFRSPWLALASLAVAQMGMMSMMGPYWSMATSFLSGTAAAGGIALINTVANFGGFLAPTLMGRLEGPPGVFTAGQLMLAATMAAGGALALIVRHDPAADRPEPLEA